VVTFKLFLYIRRLNGLGSQGVSADCLVDHPLGELYSLFVGCDKLVTCLNLKVGKLTVN